MDFLYNLNSYHPPTATTKAWDEGTLPSSDHSPTKLTGGPSVCEQLEKYASDAV